MELGVLREESSQHPGNSVAQAGGEIVQYDLRFMVGRSAMTLDVIPTDKLCEFEVCCRPLREMDQPKPTQTKVVKEIFPALSGFSLETNFRGEPHSHN